MTWGLLALARLTFFCDVVVNSWYLMGSGSGEKGSGCLPGWATGKVYYQTDSFSNIRRPSFV